MPRLHDLQSALGRLALDAPPDQDLIARIADDRPITVEARLRVHRNNSLLGLVDPLKAGFPVVAQLVGDNFFEQMVSDFIRAFPPARPDLLFYGLELAGFIASYPPAEAVPYLADMARLEMAVTFAEHAADREPLAPGTLQAIDPEMLENCCLKPHPSLRFVLSPYPLLAIWQAHQTPEPIPPIALDQGGDMLLVYRPRAETLIRQVGGGGFAFMMALATGQSLAAAYQSAVTNESEFSLTTELAALLAAEIFIEVVP